MYKRGSSAANAAGGVTGDGVGFGVGGGVGDGTGDGVGEGTGVVGRGSTEKLRSRAARPVEDVPATWTVKLDCPVWIGVPEITPVEARRRPAGSRPETIFQAYGAIPPRTSRAAAYGTWTIAVGMLVVKIFNMAAATVKFTESLACATDVDLLVGSTLLTATEICRLFG